VTTDDGLPLTHVSAALTVRRGLCYLYTVTRWDLMADTTALYALRFPDGSVSLYIDELYAQDRGIDPSQLVRVEIPREMFNEPVQRSQPSDTSRIVSPLRTP
jgi:hypothetical protein